MTEALPVRSYAKQNLALAAAFERYMVARGMSHKSVLAYNLAVSGLLDSLGGANVADTNRMDVLRLLGALTEKGCHPNTIRLRTTALRAFFKFLRLSGAVPIDPMLVIPHRKIPHRLQRVLSVAEVESLIGAARNPFERAVVEVFYATGVRVSELIKIRLEDIDFAQGTIRISKGKGGKDRVVLFGSEAAEAIAAYQKWRPSEAGLLFEAKRERPCITRNYRQWWAHVCVSGRQHTFNVGPIADFPARADAQAAADLIVSKIAGYEARPARSYTDRAIALLIGKLGKRAGLGRVHPHMLRRAFACHMLQSGADIRAIQELLGHDRITTTVLYTHLNAEDLKKAHTKAHPHGGGHAEKTKA